MRASAKYIWIFILVAFVGGFLLMETSGLLGTAPITTNTTVASVNGEDILASTWYQASQNLEQNATQQSGQSMTLDERQRLQDQAFEQLVTDALLRQEYERRGITVTDDEILQGIQLLAETEGLFTEPAGGATLAGAIRLARDGTLDPGHPTVVCITGNRYKTADVL